LAAVIMASTPTVYVPISQNKGIGVEKTAAHKKLLPKFYFLIIWVGRMKFSLFSLKTT